MNLRSFLAKFNPKEIVETDWFFAFFKKKRPEYVIEGACKQRGECCKRLILQYGGKAIQSHKQFNAMLKRNPAYSIFKPFDKVSDDGFLRCSCTKLKADGRCGIYDTRPDFCRRYPDPAMLAKGGGLLPGCGYRIVPKKNFAQLLDEELS